MCLLHDVCRCIDLKVAYNLLPLYQLYQCMREVHMQHYACALKIAAEQRATDFKPGISWLVAELFSETAK